MALPIELSGRRCITELASQISRGLTTPAICELIVHLQRHLRNLSVQVISYGCMIII